MGAKTDTDTLVRQTRKFKLTVQVVDIQQA